MGTFLNKSMSHERLITPYNFKHLFLYEHDTISIVSVSKLLANNLKSIKNIIVVSDNIDF